MKERFNTYKDMKVNPAAFVLCINPAHIDKRGHKTFAKKDREFFWVGPPGRKEKYIQPEGWQRIGWKVLKDDEPPERKAWLEPFAGDGNWYRCFHGAGTRNGKRHGVQDKDHMRLVANGIMEAGIQKATNTCHGEGAYVSNDVDYAELYSGEFQVEMLDGKKKFKLCIQVAVNPDASIRKGKQTLPNSKLRSGPGKGKTCAEYYGETLVEWVVENPSKENLRPYAMLFKEVEEDHAGG